MGWRPKLQLGSSLLAGLLPTRRLYAAGGVLLTVILGGTLGYYLIGGGEWAVADCLYMTVITISTVGFSEVLPGMDASPAARGWTVGLIISGSGTLLYFASTLVAFIVEGDLGGALRRQRMQHRINALTNHYILCGCGDTGINVLTELMDKDVPLVVIERSEKRLAWAQAELGREFPFIVGDATDDNMLIQAGIHRARSLITSLHDDAENLYVTITARALARNLRIVAKALEPAAESKLRRAGANSVVLTHLIGGSRLVTEATSPDVTLFLDQMMRQSNEPHEIIEYRIGADSRLRGCSVRDAPLRREANALILAIRQPDATKFEYNPAPERILEEGMTLILLAEAKRMAHFR